MNRAFKQSFGFFLMTATPCFAHAFLDEATPKVGSSVTIAPTEIRIKYTQGIEPAFSHISIAKDDGTMLTVGPVTVDPGDQEVLIAPLTVPLAPGHYEVRWDVVSVDTHHTNGHYTFDYRP